MSSEAYKEAGVDIDAGERAVELMKASIAKSRRKEVVGDLGGFAGLFDASALKDMKRRRRSLGNSAAVSS